MREPFFQAVSHVGSAFERGRVLQAVLKQPDVPQDVLVSVLLATASMGAFEASQVLQAAAPQRELTGHARDLYIECREPSWRLRTGSGAGGAGQDRSPLTRHFLELPKWPARLGAPTPARTRSATSSLSR